MTAFTLAARNLLVQDPDIRANVGSSPHWATWVFEDHPMVLLEYSQTCLIVISENGTWSAMESGFNVRYPLFRVDVWADPTRNPDNTVKAYDATDKIEAIFPFLQRHFHPTNTGVPPDAPAFMGSPGGMRRWGTPEQMVVGKGVTLLNCELRAGPIYSDITDVDGGVMGRFEYGAIAYY